MRRLNAPWLVGLYSIVALGLVVAAILLPWHLSNQKVPIWDEASFVCTVEDMLHAFQNGAGAGLKGMYLIRDWRPIIFPTTSVPSFAMAHGNLQLGIGLTDWLSLTLLASYTFLLLREYTVASRAFIGTLFIITTPWILNFAYRFFAELFWIAATAGWVFHLTTGQNRNPRLHFAWAGLWLGIMGATRPAETVIIAVLPLSAILAVDLWRSKLSPWDIAVIFLQSSILALMAWQLIIANSTSSLYAVVLIFIYATLTLSWARRLFFEAPILGSVVIAEVVFMAWHIPSLPELYQWSYDTSFGPMAKLPYNSFTGSSLKPLFDIFSTTFNAGLIGTLCLGETIILAIAASKNQTDDITRALRLIFIASLMLTPILFMLWVSHTMDMRRPMPSMLVLYIGMASIALIPTLPLPRARFVVLLFLTGTQLLMALANAINLRSPLIAPIGNIIGNLSPPSVEIDPNTLMMNRLQELGIVSGRLALYSLCYRDPVVGCSNRGFPVIEPVGLTALAKARGLPLYINFPLDLDFAKPETLAAQLNRQSYDRVLVDMFDKPEAIVAADPVFAHAYHFMSIVENSLPRGFEEVAIINLGGRDFHLLKAQAQ